MTMDAARRGMVRAGQAGGSRGMAMPLPLAPAEQALAGREVVLDGRRYRLVPVDEPAVSRQDAAALAQLTARELQVVALVAEGHVNKEIARMLRISEWTVSTHLR